MAHESLEDVSVEVPEAGGNGRSAYSNSSCPLQKAT